MDIRHQPQIIGRLTASGAQARVRGERHDSREHQHCPARHRGRQIKGEGRAGREGNEDYGRGKIRSDERRSARKEGIRATMSVVQSWERRQAEAQGGDPPGRPDSLRAAVRDGGREGKRNGHKRKEHERKRERERKGRGRRREWASKQAERRRERKSANLRP